MADRKHKQKRTAPRPKGEALAPPCPASAPARAEEDGFIRRVARGFREETGFSPGAWLLRVRHAESAVRDFLGGRRPGFEDLPDLIRSVPSALSSPSVQTLLAELRRMERQPSELLVVSPFGVSYTTSAPPGRLPKPVKDRARPDVKRRRLLARIGRAIASPTVKPRLAKKAQLAELERIEADARTAPRGEKEGRRADLAKSRGLGKSDDNRLEAFRTMRRRAKANISGT